MLWMYLCCVGIDVWWMRRWIPNFSLNWTLWAALSLSFLSLQLFLDGWILWRIAWLIWMAIVDHRTLHFSDFSLVIFMGLALLSAPSHPLSIWGYKLLMFMPYLCFSLLDERLGWGDTWVFGAMHVALELEPLHIWTFSTLSLALLVGFLTRRQKTPIALGPYMALAYGGLLVWSGGI